jgi:hypothetical protein
MAGIIGAGVTLRGLIPQDMAWTWNVSGVVTFDDVGELVAQDLTAANTVKLLAVDEQPIGMLASYEDRKIEGIKIGTVDHKGGFKVTYTGALAIGDSVCGSATPGVVKKAAAANRTLVVSIDAPNLSADVIFL